MINNMAIRLLYTVKSASIFFFSKVTLKTVGPVINLNVISIDPMIFGCYTSSLAYTSFISLIYYFGIN